MSSEINYLINIESKGIKLGLQRTKDLLKECLNPHENLNCIQVAGTNGKGSTSAMISNVYKSAGYKTGLFTSPHLVNVNERIRINGISIDNQDISQFVKKYRFAIEKTDASFFETITVLAFWYFKKNNVDIAIMETGLGGRLDSVTCCNPIATVITSLSMDHTEILGNTIEKIAKEKAGVIKKNVPCIMVHNDCDYIFEQKAIELNTKIFYVDGNKKTPFNSSLHGNCHNENSLLATKVINVLDDKKISKQHIKDGIGNVVWHGRNQIVCNKPFIVFDVAHNESGILSFLSYFNSIKHKGNKKLVIALQSRKKINACIDDIENCFDEIICTETSSVRGMNAEILSQLFNVNCLIFENDSTAINYVIDNSNKKDSIAIIGTHYLGYAVSSIFNISFNSI